MIPAGGKYHTESKRWILGKISNPHNLLTGAALGLSGKVARCQGPQSTALYDDKSWLRSALTCGRWDPGFNILIGKLKTYYLRICRIPPFEHAPPAVGDLKFTPVPDVSGPRSVWWASKACPTTCLTAKHKQRKASERSLYQCCEERSVSFLLCCKTVHHAGCYTEGKIKWRKSCFYENCIIYIF